MALTRISTDGVKDDAVTLAKQAAGTDGQIITYDASGNPVAVGPGTDGQVLTSTGAGSPPAFEDAAATVGGASGVDFNDDVKARFGTGNDLELYHNGTNSYINNGEGDLWIKSNGDDLVLQAVDDVLIRPQDGENGIKVLGNGAVELYHNDEKKFETDSSGAKIESSGFTHFEIRSTNNDAVLELVANNDGDTDWTIRNDLSASNDLVFRFNNSHKMDLDSSGNLTATSFIGDGSSLTGLQAGATGGNSGANAIFWENEQTVTHDYTITNARNAGTWGPVTINSGVTVTIGDGEYWTIM